jgi:hypothetical protein
MILSNDSEPTSCGAGESPRPGTLPEFVSYEFLR